MRKRELRSWKKVFESDLPHIAFEMKDFVEPPAVLILDGKMGMGKTTFAKVFIGDETMSPTYSVLSETPQALHADFYRIKTREEILHLELGLYLEDKKYFLVEWGKDFYSNFISEVPDSFSHYLLTIESSSEADKNQRNFVLYSISDE